MEEPIARISRLVGSDCRLQLALAPHVVHDWLSSLEGAGLSLAAGELEGVPSACRVNVSPPLLAPRSVLYAVRVQAGEVAPETLFGGWIRLLARPDGRLTLCVEGREHPARLHRLPLSSALARLVANRCLAHAMPQEGRLSA